MNHNLPSSVTVNEHEQSQETYFPVEPIEPAISTSSAIDESFPKSGYQAHEGLLAFRGDEQGTIKILADTDAGRALLEGKGMQALSYAEAAVPYTGGDDNHRIDNQGQLSSDYLRVLRAATYDVAAQSKGLKDVSWESLSNEQQSELKEIGFQGTGPYNLSLLSDAYQTGDMALVSSGAFLDQDALVERAKDIGTFSYVEEGDRAMVALTDHLGNQMLAPKSETLDMLLTDLGYESLDAPTFSTDFSDEQLRMNGLSSARRAVWAKSPNVADHPAATSGGTLQ